MTVIEGGMTEAQASCPALPSVTWSWAHVTRVAGALIFTALCRSMLGTWGLLTGCANVSDAYVRVNRGDRV